MNHHSLMCIVLLIYWKLNVFDQQQWIGHFFFIAVLFDLDDTVIVVMVMVVIVGGNFTLEIGIFYRFSVSSMKWIMMMKSKNKKKTFGWISLIAIPFQMFHYFFCLVFVSPNFILSKISLSNNLFELGISLLREYHSN